MKKLPNEELLLNPKPGTAAAAARDFGIDLTLTVQNLCFTPEERIQRLDSLVDTIADIRASSKSLEKLLRNTNLRQWQEAYWQSNGVSDTRLREGSEGIERRVDPIGDDKLGDVLRRT